MDSETAPFYAELIKDIEQRVNELGYDLFLRSLTIGEDFKKEISQLLSNRGIAGILLIATDMLSEDVDIIRSLNSNLVVIDTYFDSMDVNCVVMDNYQGAYKAAEYLVSLGHDKIGYIESMHRIYNFEMRKKGFMKFLTKKVYLLMIKMFLALILQLMVLSIA